MGHNGLIMERLGLVTFLASLPQNTTTTNLQNNRPHRQHARGRPRLPDRPHLGRSLHQCLWMPSSSYSTGLRRPQRCRAHGRIQRGYNVCWCSSSRGERGFIYLDSLNQARGRGRTSEPYSTASRATPPTHRFTGRPSSACFHIPPTLSSRTRAAGRIRARANH
jgi:hypothetical protein